MAGEPGLGGQAVEPETPGYRLHSPPIKPQSVFRSDLVQRLRFPGDATVVTLVAPAGYGKTTALAQYAARETQPTAWLWLDRSDTDPAVLLQDIAASLGAAGLVGSVEPWQTGFAGPTAVSAGVDRLMRMIGRDRGPGVLILDHMERIRGRSAQDVIAEMVYQLDGRIRVILASRAEGRLPLGVWRAEHNLLEIGPAELRMDRAEAAVLIEQMGVKSDLLDPLLEYSEGWPVGLYLACLASRSGMAPPTGGVMQQSDRYVADYMREVLLAPTPKRKLEFMMETSILDDMSGPLCDSVLESSGSAQMLESLEKSDLPIVPLDRSRQWYRYHHMLRDVLRRELEIRNPDRIAGLHDRASVWFEQHGLPATAIHHAQVAGDADRAARIVASVARVTFARGQSITLLGWLEWFENTGQLERHPDLAGIGALTYAVIGDGPRADRWGAIASNSPKGATSPPSLILRALQCRSGLAAMAADAASLRMALPPGSEWLPTALVLEALPMVWQGDSGDALPLLAEAVSVGKVVPAAATPLAPAQQSFIAMSTGNWSEAKRQAAHALELIDRQGLEGYSTSGLGIVAAARCARHSGDLDATTELLGKATAVRPYLSAALSGIAVQTLLELATAHLEMSDVAAARAALTDAEDILVQRPDLGRLGDRVRTMRKDLEAVGLGRIGTLSLTKAELRLLPLLATHLSFAEIAEQFFVSQHTVKSQAASIYRKLEASSRSEAVDKARANRLLSGET